MISGEPVVILRVEDYEALMGRARKLIELENAAQTWDRNEIASWFLYTTARLGRQ